MIAALRFTRFKCNFQPYNYILYLNEVNEQHDLTNKPRFIDLFIQLDLMPQINMIQIMYIFFKNTFKEKRMKIYIKTKMKKET